MGPDGSNTSWEHKKPELFFVSHFSAQKEKAQLISQLGFSNSMPGDDLLSHGTLSSEPTLPSAMYRFTFVRRGHGKWKRSDGSYILFFCTKRKTPEDCSSGVF
ncbi:hypothetical protein [Endozoicomonas sp. OPT23]|uniref:hypothetical protein n=1 Tax=Endozoicomonas sp. OPT23 TaxID=2072845 RepID=UPI00129BF31D|nr:hypothetical protein [Endozoicomonas sp. OPT23]